ncbi:MAG: hypothetical protein FJ271_18635 [Planctomycetes bacterium]|nr:hypothetical protein [Planctomycetota bacterium]
MATVKSSIDRYSNDRASMKDESGKLTSEALAALIVDALLQAGIVACENLDEAIAIATEEIDVRKAAGDY